MKSDPQRHRRKSYRLRSHAYAQAAAYFRPLRPAGTSPKYTQDNCTYDRILDGVFGGGREGVADEYFRSIPEHFPHAEIDVYQVMPNHVHGIIVLFDAIHRTARAPLPAFPHVAPG